MYRVTVPPRIRQSSRRLFHAMHPTRPLHWSPRAQQGTLGHRVERSLLLPFCPLLHHISLSFSLFLSSPASLYHWRFQFRCHWRRHGAYGRMCPRHQRQATGDQIRSSRITVSYQEQAMKAPYRARQFFKTVRQQVHHFKVDVIAVISVCDSIQILQTARVLRFVQFLGCRHVERDATRGQIGTYIWKQTSYRLLSNNHSSQHTSASDLDSCFKAILS